MSFKVVLLWALSSALVAACSTIPRAVVPKDPLSAVEHVTLGEAYHVKGLTDAAEKEFQGALRRDPRYVPALVALGNLAFEKGTLPIAESYYRQALAYNPDHPHANNNLAMVYLSRGERLSEAEQLATRALQGPPSLRPYVLDTLIGLYMKQGRIPEALIALDEAEQSVSPQQEALRERFRQLRASLTTHPVAR